jgi:hypothetical protein
MRGKLGVLVCAALLFGGFEARAEAASMNVTGPTEVVYDWSTMACEPVDSADIPVHAFRDGLGRTQLTLPLYVNHRMIGPDLDHLTHDCQVTLSSNFEPQPSNYDDADWLTSPYALSSGEIYGLVHDEYHGRDHPGACPSGVHLNCRYNTITLAHSVTNGDTYVRNTPPANLVASMPYQYVPDSGRYGVFAPSNIISKDGFYYAFVLVSRAFEQQEAGECLMRTTDLGDAKSWRAWDGQGFNVRFIDPYREAAEPRTRHTCKPVDPDDLKLAESVVYDTLINKYIAIGGAAKFDPTRGDDVWGFYYTTSDDLLNWSDRQLLLETPRYATHMCGDPDPLVYPSILDPSSTDRNYNTADQTAYVYFTRFNYVNCALGWDRDLLRVPVQISP